MIIPIQIKKVEYQKGAIEVNYELVRRVIPKESNFDDLTQEDIFKMMNHINSYKRKKLNNRSPYDAFSFYHGEDLFTGSRRKYRPEAKTSQKVKIHLHRLPEINSIHHQ